MATSNNNLESNFNNLSTDSPGALPGGDSQPSNVWFIPKDMTLPARMQKGPSHSKRQPVTHIPRPRNPFILFRSHFLSMEILPTSIDFCRDHRQVSRIVSCVWAALSNEDRLRFFELGDIERNMHKARYPSYKTTGKDTRVRVTLTSMVTEQSSLNPEELACKRIAGLIVGGLRDLELAHRIQAIVEHVPKSRSAGPKSSKKRSAVPRSVSPRPATPPSNAQVVLGKSPSGARRGSSTVSGNSSNLDVYARTTNPPRRRSAINYAEFDSDDEDIDEIDSDELYDDEVEVGGPGQSFPSRYTSITPSTVAPPSTICNSTYGRSDRASGASDQSSSVIQSPLTGDESEFLDTEMYDDEQPTNYVDWSNDITFSKRMFDDEDVMDFSEGIDISGGSPYASFGVHNWEEFSPTTFHPHAVHDVPKKTAF